MKYIGKTLQFVNRNFIYMAILGIVPAILLTIQFDPAALIHLLKEAELSGGFSRIFLSLTLIFNRPFWYTLIVLLTFALSVSLLFSFIERRMRVGTLSVLKPFTRLNETFFRVVPFIVIIVLSYELFAFLLSVLVSLVILGGHIVSAIFVPIISLGMYALITLYFTIFVQWLPNMFIPGYRMTEALALSAKGVQGRVFSVFFGLFFPFLVTIPLMVLARLFLNFIGFYNVVYVACYLFILIYCLSFMMVVFFECTGRERVDLRTYYPAK